MRQEFKPTIGIYALSDPVTGRVMYVGQSIDIEFRFRQHCKQTGFAGNLKKSEWVAGLFRQGLKPKSEVLEECASTTELDLAEKKWIRHFKARGEAELNMSGGGSTRASTVGSNVQREEWFQFALKLRETRSLLSQVAGDSLKVASVKHFDVIAKLGRNLDREAQKMAQEIQGRFPEWKEIFDALWQLK
jgi:hypothetical protein